MTRRAKAVASGFTMIELVMVIIILGIMSITILPRFVSPSVFSERLFFDDLRQSLMYARDVALARGCRVQAVLFVNDFYVMQDTDCDSSTYLRSDYTLPVMRPDNNTRLEFNAFDDEGHAAINTASQILVFEPTGVVKRDNVGALVELTTLTLTAGSHTLTIYGDSGYVD